MLTNPTSERKKFVNNASESLFAVWVSVMSVF